DAIAAGIAIIDPGHNSEKIMKVHVAEWLQQQLVELKSATKVVASQVETETFTFM
ncbi:MAG: hypothetical protein K0Q59_4910, partial [Paenibacillus sp.]|nr:hypothetical protein [Paenibacillus sp.]